VQAQGADTGSQAQVEANRAGEKTGSYIQPWAQGPHLWKKKPKFLAADTMAASVRGGRQVLDLPQGVLLALWAAPCGRWRAAGRTPAPHP